MQSVSIIVMYIVEDVEYSIIGNIYKMYVYPTLLFPSIDIH